MKNLIAAALATATLAVATPAFAQDAEAESDLKITGSVTLASDYRFRGVSQTNKAMAIQGGVTATHSSGVYVGTWASNLAGWGTFGGSNTELDIFGGYAVDLGGATLDVGLTWYMYPGGSDKTDFAEPYVKISTTQGPVSILAGVAYAPSQEALGKWYFTGADAAAGVYNDPGDKEDNWYVWGDVAYAIPETPVKLKAHLGYSDGNSGLGPNATSVTPTGEYLDWLLGAEVAYGPLTLGVSYIDTNISNRESAYLLPSFSSTKDGSSIAGSTVLVSVTAAF